MSRGTTHVITVNEQGEALGTEPVESAHTGEGVLHAAISVQVMDPWGRWLVQRRVDHKPTFGGRWANTCCSHPRPGEDPADAAIRRVYEELGIRLDSVRGVGTFTYRAVDPDSAYVEHEYDHVFVATAASDVALDLDPEQIAETRWVSRAEAQALAAGPDGAPWFGLVADLVIAAPQPGEADHPES